jgi:hypothetical protein
MARYLEGVAVANIVFDNTEGAPARGVATSIGFALSKSARRHTGDFAEHAAEMTLAGKTEFSRDLDKRLPLRDQLLRAGNALLHYVSVRRRAKGVKKCPEKLPRTELH